MTAVSFDPTPTGQEPGGSGGGGGEINTNDPRLLAAVLSNLTRPVAAPSGATDEIETAPVDSETPPSGLGDRPAVAPLSALDSPAAQTAAPDPTDWAARETHCQHLGACATSSCMACDPPARPLYCCTICGADHRPTQCPKVAEEKARQRVEERMEGHRICAHIARDFPGFLAEYKALTKEQRLGVLYSYVAVQHQETAKIAGARWARLIGS